MFQTKVVEKIKIHILCSITFFRKTCRLRENVEKYCTAGERHRRKCGACALRAGYLRLKIHTLRLCNTHCFSTATMVALPRLNVTFIRTLTVLYKCSLDYEILGVDEDSNLLRYYAVSTGHAVQAGTRLALVDSEKETPTIIGVT